METRPLVPRVVPLTHRGAAKIFRRADPRILVLMVAALGLITLISASGGLEASMVGSQAAGTTVRTRIGAGRLYPGASVLSGSGLGGTRGDSRLAVHAEGGAGETGMKKVFVAGATGKLGSRIVTELLKSGNIQVIAGVRNPSKLQGIMNEFVSEGRIDRKYTDNLETVTLDLESESPAGIQSKISGCSTVVSAIGASEANFFDTSGPRRIDGDAAISLVEAAKAADASKFVMVSAIGTGDKMFTFPAGLLNLFWGVLFQKQRAENALKASGLDFTIVRPGGMEKPKDDFKYTHNLQCFSEDCLSGGVVSRQQIAELISAAILNPEVSSDQVFEVIAETPEYAPNRTMVDAMQAQIKVMGNQG
ncbi:hypothetical protein AAMO2058_000749000 [Amorphochlora amoebiformis]